MRQRIYLLSSNIPNLSTALISGFCIVPLSNNIKKLEDELFMAEKYLISNRWNKYPKVQNLNDFKFLTEYKLDEP
jgi:hypothetical protein